MSNYITVNREEYFKMLRDKTQLEKENDILKKRILRNMQEDRELKKS